MISKRKNKRISSSGFTLIELLIVVAIIGVLSSIILTYLTKAKDSAYMARAKVEFRTIATAIELYTLDHGDVLPADVNRGLPPGLEAYLPGGDWPNGPWPGSFYDWDNHIHPLTGQPVVQISIRFCPYNDFVNCTFPNEPWAAGFDYYSSVYYCILGACTSYLTMPPDHPGYCVNC